MNYVLIGMKTRKNCSLFACTVVVFYIVYFISSPTYKHVTLNDLNGNEYHQNVTECLCYRKFMYPPPSAHAKTGKLPKRLNSSCSDEGTLYQEGQNIISFSLYIQSHRNGKMQKTYTEGIKQNLEMMQNYYPNYSLRVYTNIQLEKGSPYCQLVCSNSDIFWCNMKYTPSHGNLLGMVFRTWRFLALGDPTVDVFLSRDLDSLISSREAAVVEHWLSKNDKAISLMRDRKKGHNVPILAGMWQASNEMLGMVNASSLRGEIIKLSKTKNEHRYKNSDQKILDKVIFYPRAKEIVAYDSYNCVKWGKITEVRPFPTQRDEPRRDFVGNHVDFLNKRGRYNYSETVCPIQCRPEYGKDWIYC